MEPHPSFGLFVTGTDTGVGKTHVGTALAAALAARGVDVRVRKPVESGCAPREGALFPADADALRRAAGAREPLQSVCRYRLAAPLSPERAAALEGVALELDMLHRACVDAVPPEACLLVEGAGGFYSPIARGALNADLAVRLGLPVLLVTADRLGTIHHTLLAAEALRARGLRLAAVVLNRVGADVDREMDNAGELERWLGHAVLRFPHGGDAAAAERALAPLLAALAERRPGGGQ